MTDLPLNEQSSTVLFYIGTAAEDLADGSTELKVFCPQLIPAGTGGTLSGEDTLLSVKGTTYGKTEKRTDIVTSGSTITCVYFGGGDLPLARPPRVSQGESVEVRQYDTSNTYYWRPRGANNNYRKVDQLLITVGASPSIGDKSTSNSYCIHIDPTVKQIVLSTSSANGEVANFTMTMDGETGNFGVVSSEGESIAILKDAHTIVMSNANGASVTISDKNVAIVAPENIVMNSKRIVTNLTGSDARNGTSYQDFEAVMALVKKCFDEVQSAVGAPTSHSGLMALVKNAIMEDDKGR